MSIGTRAVWSKIVWVVALVLAVMGATGSPARGGQGAPLRVVATTTLIAEIVRDVGGDAVEVVTMISPGSCPGHFDLKPDDMKLLAHARLFLTHVWQGKQFGDRIAQASGNPALERVAIEPPDNWMIPSARMKATDGVAEALAKADPGHAAVYRAAAERRKDEVRRVGDVQAQRLATAGVSRIPVLANGMQADFLRWAGFQVVGTFDRGEDMSPVDVENAISLGRAKSVRLVVDNLQSGKQAGAGMAGEIGAAHVTLSNFPGGFPDTDTWARALEKNVDLLLAAAAKP